MIRLFIFFLVKSQESCQPFIHKAIYECCLLTCLLALPSTKSKYFLCHKIIHDNIVSLSSMYVHTWSDYPFPRCSL